MRRVLINCFGRVQMLGFRYSTLQKARQLNISGCVRNVRDGTVEIEAQGEDLELNKFIEWAKKGPSYSIVKKIILEEMEIRDGDNEFKIFD